MVAALFHAGPGVHRRQAMKIIEVIADTGHVDTITSIAEQNNCLDVWTSPPSEDGRQTVRMIVLPKERQDVLDALQNTLGTSEKTRINVIPLEVTLPREQEEKEEVSNKKSTTTTREELYDNIEKGSRLDGNFLLLVFLSTIVAAIGLIEDNVAVIIGAMVIAPLLGPNLALALATALGDNQLMWKSLQTNLVGLIFALAVTAIIGYLWPGEITSRELMSRTDVGLDGVVLALASGAAAVLSLTTGLPSVLVGVMVAVALLPPATTMGLMLGQGHFDLMGGAGLLLAVNIVCVNLSAKLVMLVKGVRPRTWLEKQKARQSTTTYIVFWIISLAILITVIIIRGDILFIPAGQ